MRDSLLSKISRNQRRAVLAAADGARRSGNWGPWETVRFPLGTVGLSGWPAEITVALKNRVFSVLMRDAGNGIVHLAVTSLSEVRPSWHEMQRIKNEIAGETKTAVEIYQPKSQIVDGANMYHIWVLPDDLPFGLCAHPTTKERAA